MFQQKLLSSSVISATNATNTNTNTDADADANANAKTGITTERTKGNKMKKKQREKK